MLALSETESWTYTKCLTVWHECDRANVVGENGGEGRFCWGVGERNRRIICGYRLVHAGEQKFVGSQESMDSAEVAALNSQHACLNWWMIIVTSAVVVGLILEYGAEFRHAWHTWKWRIWKWKPLLPKVGAILVVIGVAGELFVHYKLSQVDDKLLAIQNAEILRLVKQNNFLMSVTIRSMGGGL